MLEWLKVKSRWAPETQQMIVHEFLEKQGLFGQLLQYAKKRIR